MKNRQGNNTGQKYFDRRYDRSYGSDVRRSSRDLDQVESIKTTDQRVLMNALEYHSTTHMYQGNGFRSFSNSQNQSSNFRADDHFRSHAGATNFSQTIHGSRGTDSGSSKGSPNTSLSRQPSCPPRQSLRHNAIDGSHSQTNKINEVFNDVLGEKPPELNSGQGSSRPSFNPFVNGLSTCGGSSGGSWNQNLGRGRWRRDERHKTQQWENHDRSLRSRDRHKRHHNASDARPEDDGSEQMSEPPQKKKHPEASKKSSTPSPPEATLSKEASSAKDSQEASENTLKTKKSDLTESRSSAKVIGGDAKKSKEKEPIKEKPASAVSMRMETPTDASKAKCNKALSSSSSSLTSSSGSDTDCVIEEETSTCSREPLDKVKSKSRAIMQSTSSATSRPSHPSNMGRTPPTSKDEGQRKKKDALKSKEATSTSSAEPRLAQAVTSPSNVVTNISSSSSLLTVATSTLSGPSSVKKPLSKADLIKLITPRSRKDQQRVEQLMREYTERRERPHSLHPVVAPASSTGPSPTSSDRHGDAPFSLEQLDLSSLDFKALKTEIPEELSEVINKVLDFHSTEKNPIILDDDDAAAQREESPGQPRKRNSDSDAAPGKLPRDSDSTRLAGSGRHSSESSVLPSEPVTSSDFCQETKFLPDELAQLSENASHPPPSSDGSAVQAASTAPASNPSSGTQPLPTRLLETLLQISLKENELQDRIATVDLEIQNIQAMIVTLSHELTTKKHHRDMMINDDKRLKAIRLQALRASVENKITPEHGQQLMTCTSSSTSATSTVPAQSGLGGFMLDLPSEGYGAPDSGTVINIMPQSEDMLSIGLPIPCSEGRAACIASPGEAADCGLQSPRQNPIRPILSPPKPSGQVRYLGTLNDITHLFRRPGSANSEPPRGADSGSNPRPSGQVAADVGRKEGEPTASPGCSTDIARIKSEMADVS